MKLLKLLFNFYLNASIHVALSAVAFLRITALYFNLDNNTALNCFLFFGTITGYNFVKYAGVAKLHHRSLTNTLKAIQLFSLFSFVGLCYFTFQIDTHTLCYMLPFGVLTVLYAVPFLSGFEKNLRQVSYLKIVVVALVWTGFTVLIPVIDAQKAINTQVIFMLLQRFLIVVILILPFDIRDVKYDAISLQTIPKKIGVEKTKKLGLILMIFSLILEYLASSSNMVKTPFMVFFFLTLLFLMRSKINQSKYYSSLWVEALPIIWWLILLGFDNF
ncbi:hypothetical protein DUT90_05715 [Polaribacter sp. WD7]|uniref:hypothetical protein n=1 Tax=Polaribacter sp. WD7 TaxID=2269061 RepID=UPI000DF3025C|nr:hypothetical protein [Polaribacter sp. WD7]RCS27608.1 hypothetical protein DUT90_05715 [Polaribacter sp. WD7]